MTVIARSGVGVRVMGMRVENEKVHATGHDRVHDHVHDHDHRGRVHDDDDRSKPCQLS